MLKDIANVLAPHYCCSCGEIGAILCEHCKYDIISESFERCIVCLGPVRSHSHLCATCRPPYTRAWCVGERNEALKSVIDAYKFDSMRVAAEALVDLLDQTVPRLPPQTRVVAVPTIATHVRIRGYDHMELIARLFAQRRALTAIPALHRTNNLHQQGASRRQRLDQAKHAFRSDPVESVPYLLIDDVYTTGATVHYAARTLCEAGASEVYVAVLSRQPLEKNDHL